MGRREYMIFKKPKRSSMIRPKYAILLSLLSFSEPESVSVNVSV